MSKPIELMVKKLGIEMSARDITTVQITAIAHEDIFEEVKKYVQLFGPHTDFPYKIQFVPLETEKNPYYRITFYYDGISSSFLYPRHDTLHQILTDPEYGFSQEYLPYHQGKRLNLHTPLDQLGFPPNITDIEIGLYKPPKLAKEGLIHGPIEEFEPHFTMDFGKPHPKGEYGQ